MWEQENVTEEFYHVLTIFKKKGKEIIEKVVELS